DADAHARRRRARIGDDVPEAPHRFPDGAEARVLRTRSGLPEAGYADHDEARIDRRQLGPSEAPLLQGAGAKVLQKEVRLARELAQDGLPFRLAQIERDRLLVAPDHRPPERGLAFLLPPP